VLGPDSFNGKSAHLADENEASDLRGTAKNFDGVAIMRSIRDTVLAEIDG
jgi:hypothetical protein